MKVLDKIDQEPRNPMYRETTDHPVNWLVFTISNSNEKRYFVRIHPNFISASEDFSFTTDDLDSFEDAWFFIADGEIEAKKLEAVRPYVTFIINKLAYLLLLPRESVVEKIQNEELFLVDYFISNN